MDTSTTSTEAIENLATGEISDQATLEQAIAEETAKLAPKEEAKAESKEPEPLIVASKEEEEPKRYSALRKDYDKLTSELKQLKAEAKARETKAKLADMDYDQKIDFLLENQGKVEEPTEEQVFEPDYSAIDEFVSSDKELKLLGKEVAGMFKALAVSDDYVDSSLTGGEKIKWKQVKLEDIKQHFFRPLIEKLAGTKVTVKERPLRGTSSAPEDALTPDRIEKMSPKEYEKNREKILRGMGVNI